MNWKSIRKIILTIVIAVVCVTFMIIGVLNSKKIKDYKSTESNESKSFIALSDGATSSDMTTQTNAATSNITVQNNESTGNIPVKSGASAGNDASIINSSLDIDIKPPVISDEKIPNDNNNISIAIEPVLSNPTATDNNYIKKPEPPVIQVVETEVSIQISPEEQERLLKEKETQTQIINPEDPSYDKFRGVLVSKNEDGSFLAKTEKGELCLIGLTTGMDENLGKDVVLRGHHQVETNNGIPVFKVMDYYTYNLDGSINIYSE